MYKSTRSSLKEGLILEYRHVCSKKFKRHLLMPKEEQEDMEVLKRACNNAARSVVVVEDDDGSEKSYKTRENPLREKLV